MSTERMNDSQGTARMDAGTARMDTNIGGAVTAAGVVFVSGQTIVLSGKNCVIDSTISGSTGEAVVYKVIIDGKPYALKLYKSNMPLSDTAKKVITKIKDNPNNRIIRIYGFGRYNEQDFEIMEYAEGGTLDQYLKSNGAIHDTTKVKNIVKMITEGLEQLHGEHKVIYQDLKPENIYFRDANKTSLVLADFGISSVMEGLDEKVEVTASVTDLYAAPELAHKGNTTKVMVTPAVDYFALGITMFELWLGEKPFKGVKATKRDYLIAEEKVDLPIDMPDDYATLIKGLIKPQRKDRWGNEQVRKWLKGEALVIEPKASQKASAVYDPLEFSNTESATTPQELASLMEKYPDIGKTCLYDGIIKEWFKKAGNLRLYNEIQNIASQYANDKDAGLYTAILALDLERPFKSRGGKICKTTEDIADAIMAESAYYMEDLKKPNANLYLYLAATEGSQGKEAANAFCKYFKEYSPKKALALVCLKLQSDGGITIGSKHYQNPDELKNEKDGVQIDLVKKAVTEKDSMLLLWLSDIYGNDLKSTDGFNNLSILEQFFLLDLFPYLSYKELGGNSWNALRYLINSCPGRSDLFERYVAQGLPLTDQDWRGDKRTSIEYVVCNFNELSKKHGTDIVYNLIRLLCKLGADVNEYSGDGTCPLINAYNLKDNDLAKLLLELGADENQYRVYLEDQKEQQYIKLVQTKDRASSEYEYQNLAKEFLDMNGYRDTEALANDCKKQITILKERREEQERERQERIMEEKQKEQERREEQERIERERKAEQERIEEQSRKWRKAGRCGDCGGRLRYKFDHDIHGNEPWVDRLKHPVCKSCGATYFFGFNDYETKRIRAIWKIVEVIAAIVGSLMIHNFFILIPFIIIFIVPFFNGGFGKFIRITSIVAQVIISISIIIANISSPIIILGSIIIGSIILNLSCIMAYKESLFIGHGWKILSYE
jgi:serine/threonine protein kinase